MIVAVTGSAVELRDPDNFRQFHVAADPGTDIAVALAAAGAGLPADDADVFVTVDWLRTEAARLGVGDDWSAGFAAMLDYAATNGWLNDDHTAIRAHVEP
ncbi:MAG TPA: hypothetical protein VNQ73_18805 [Ilumatobacter sp.]|nr:hypothetical protein [Ilumatobacter sp.]